MDKVKIIKEISISDNIINISDNPKIKDGWDKREWKTIIFTEYQDNRNDLKIRPKIKVSFVDGGDNLTKGDRVILKISKNTIVGRGKFIQSTGEFCTLENLEIFFKKTNTPEDESYTNDVNELFRLFNNEELKERNLSYNTNDNEKIIKEKYKKGLFRIYYKMLEISASNLSNNVENKYSAMCGYLAARDCFKDYGIILSYPNCFIKGYKREYDALLLKKSNTDYFLNIDDIKATMEIKVSGFFCPKLKSSNDKNSDTSEYETMYEAFEDYISDQHNVTYIDKKDKRKGKNYNNVLPIPHIYFTFHESSSKIPKGNRERCYDTCRKVINDLNRHERTEDNYFGIFCSVKNNNEKFIIPIEYDLDEIVNKIKKMCNY